MITSMYEQYLWLIGKLKDGFKMEVEADHRNIHTFYAEKRPIFKLMFGTFTDKAIEEIVVSFNIDVHGSDAVYWWTKIQELHPPIRLTEVHIEDDQGETYLGEDAVKIYTLKLERQAIKAWLQTANKEQMKEFAESKIVGRLKDRKFFDSQTELDKAIIEFDLMKKPVDDGEIQ